MLVINDVGQTTDNTTRDLWFTCHTDELYFQEILLSLDDWKIAEYDLSVFDIVVRCMS